MELSETMIKTYPKNIVDAFGGIAALSKLAGLPRSTLKSWLARNQIPDRRKPALLELAKENGIPLTEADFFPR